MPANRLECRAVFEGCTVASDAPRVCLVTAAIQFSLPRVGGLRSREAGPRRRSESSTDTQSTTDEFPVDLGLVDRGTILPLRLLPATGAGRLARRSPAAAADAAGRQVVVQFQELLHGLACADDPPGVLVVLDVADAR